MKYETLVTLFAKHDYRGPDAVNWEARWAEGRVRLAEFQRARAGAAVVADTRENTSAAASPSATGLRLVGK